MQLFEEPPEDVKFELRGAFLTTRVVSMSGLSLASWHPCPIFTRPLLLGFLCYFDHNRVGRDLEDSSTANPLWELNGKRRKSSLDGGITLPFLLAVRSLETPVD